jgi:N-acetyl-alpha-D-glucosaminyl L-malate synthase BshA
MRIGIICHASLGGSGRIAGELALELSRRGHRVHLFSRSEPFAARQLRRRVALHPVFESQGDFSPCCDLHMDWPLSEVQALIHLVMQVHHQEGLDLLHFHYALPFAAIVGEIKKRLGPAAPLVIGTVHGTDVSIHGCHPISGPQLAKDLKSLDGLTTVSHSHAALAAQLFSLPELPDVIPNFVNLNRFRPDLSAPPGILAPVSINGRKFRIVHVSNFRALKNPRGLAQIFLGIREKLAAELWLVGHGPEVGWLQSFLQMRGMTQDVHFLGVQHQVGPILAQSDLLLMPSQAESFCLAALEAMACGVPVLATSVGGLPEVVMQGKTGLLFPPEDSVAAVDLAVALLSDPVRHQEMRGAAVSRARSFGQIKVVTAYENYYRRLLLSRRSRSLRFLRTTGHSWSGAAAHLRRSLLQPLGFNQTCPFLHEERHEPL